MAQKNSNVIGIVVLVIVLAGLGYWKFNQRPKQIKETNLNTSIKEPVDLTRKRGDGPLIFVAGYLSEKQLEAMKKGNQRVMNYYKSKGLDFEFRYTAADPARVVLIEPDWDFALSSGGITITQHFNGTKMRPLLWNRSCEYVTQMVAPKDSNIYNPIDFAGKKILIFTYGYLSPNQLQAMKDWNLDKATLYTVSDPRKAYAALQSRQVDAVMSDAAVGTESQISHVFGPYPNEFIKVVGQTKTDLPCRIINVATNTDPESVNLLLRILEEDKDKKPGEEVPRFFERMTVVGKGEFEDIAKKYDMQVLAKYKELPKDFDQYLGSLPQPTPPVQSPEAGSSAPGAAAQ